MALIVPEFLHVLLSLVVMHSPVFFFFFLGGGGVGLHFVSEKKKNKISKHAQ